ncbi:MAG: hypothetical protein KJ601_06290, partial [Nanoarchaeota archaeon]|nr:hypothetical protein [Nanoarchaeota archaeon]
MDWQDFKTVRDFLLKNPDKEAAVINSVNQWLSSQVDPFALQRYKTIPVTGTLTLVEEFGYGLKGACSFEGDIRLAVDVDLPLFYFTAAHERLHCYQPVTDSTASQYLDELLACAEDPMPVQGLKPL